MRIVNELRYICENFLHIGHEISQDIMERLLLGNLAHEMRTPMNAVVNYLEVASESNHDTETNAALDQSRSAYSSLNSAIRHLIEQSNNTESVKV